LATLVREETDALLATAASRDLKLTTRVEPGNYLMRLDELKIRQTMGNIIDNALYYAADKDTVSVQLRKTGKRVIFEVTDHGIGVPKGDKARIFDKFVRASNAIKRRPDGTGVGLYLARKVITAHGGEMIVDSREGKGSTFGFWLKA
jgi:signal transduction histidine kinase